MRILSAMQAEAPGTARQPCGRAYPRPAEAMDAQAASIVADHPSVLGIKPIPKLLDKYSAETIDIDDVDFEEVDSESDALFGSYSNVVDNQTDKDSYENNDEVT